jgi:hypothetical protein
MDAVGITLVFVGAFMLYEAVKNPQPHPLQKATTALNASTN